MSIAVDRVQNYYQYNDAERKFYQLLKKENQEVMQVSQEEIPAKKSKKSKKTSVSSDGGEPLKEVKKTKPIAKQETKEEDLSAKTDSGIVDESTLETAAAKKKSKSKKQREKKAAAAALAAAQTSESPKDSQAKEKIVIDLTSPTVAPTTAKPKDKKKKSKSSSAEQKPKEDNAKNGPSSTSSNLVSEIANARQHIKTSLERVDGASALSGPNVQFLDRISALEKDNSQLRNVVDGLQKLTISLEQRLKQLEGGSSAVKSVPVPSKPADDDDDVDLFGSDEEEDAEAEKVKEERLAAYAAKKSKKPALIAKSSILLDIKPWDDETDMKEMEKKVRTIQMDGLLMGVSKLVPLAYGINKLQIAIVIEDDKVSVDELQEKIEAFEDFVQSVDIAAFNKI